MIPQRSESIKIWPTSARDATAADTDDPSLCHWVCDRLGLSEADLSVWLGVPPKRVVSGLSEGDFHLEPEPRRRLFALAQLAESLAEVVRREYIPTWLTTPSRALDDRSPQQAWLDGQIDEVLRSAALLGSGEPI